MTNKKALAIVLRMAKSLASIHRAGREREAIEEVEQLLTQFEDTGNYTEDDYMEN